MYFASKGIQKSCIWTIIFKYTKILNEVNWVHLMNELILDMVSLDTTEVFSSPNGTWSFTIFPLAVSHTTSITYFHLWCMFEGRVWLWKKSDPFREAHWGAEPNLAPLSMPNWVWTSINRYRMSFFLVFCWNLHNTSNHHALQTYWRRTMLYATQPTPNRKSCCMLCYRTTLIFGNM